MKTTITGSGRKVSLRRFAILGLSFCFLFFGGVFLLVGLLQPTAGETQAGRPSALERNLADTLGNLGLAKPWATNVQRRELIWQLDEVVNKTLSNVDADSLRKMLEDAAKDFAKTLAGESMASLVERCQKMLERQIAVHDATKDVHKAIQTNTSKKAGPKDQKISVELSDKQKAIVVDAKAAIEMLKGEGAAVAFLETFEKLCIDMECVQRRLESGDVGDDILAIEEGIIQTLKDVIAALHKR
jgi:hypothetical protein